MKKVVLVKTNPTVELIFHKTQIVTVSKLIHMLKLKIYIRNKLEIDTNKKLNFLVTFQPSFRNISKMIDYSKKLYLTNFSSEQHGYT